MKNAEQSLLFYDSNKLVTLSQKTFNHSLLRAGNASMAEQRAQSDGQTTLLATDLTGSVTHAKTNTDREPATYTAYGYRTPSDTAPALGFNGEYLNSTLPLYLLGNGHRSFNPALMRFHSPDSLSPFGKGGVNSYTYCGGDPINRLDPSGRFFRTLLSGIKGAKNLMKLRVPRKFRATPDTPSTQGEPPPAYHRYTNANSKPVPPPPYRPLPYSERPPKGHVTVATRPAEDPPNYWGNTTVRRLTERQWVRIQERISILNSQEEIGLRAISNTRVRADVEEYTALVLRIRQQREGLRVRLATSVWE
jgi:RHS repeat-associated protein